MRKTPKKKKKKGLFQESELGGGERPKKSFLQKKRQKNPFNKSLGKKMKT